MSIGILLYVFKKMNYNYLMISLFKVPNLLLTFHRKQLRKRIPTELVYEFHTIVTCTNYIKHINSLS